MANNTLDELTRVKFVGQDFDTHYNEVVDFLTLNYPDEINDYVNNNLGVANLQAIAWPSQNIAFYINQRTTNLFLTESSSPVAISRLARMLNYDIQPAIPFRTDVTIELENGPYAFIVKIEPGFRFNAINGLTYEYRGDSAIVYSPGETQKTFTIEEGVTTRNVFVSTGDPNQVFQLAGLETDEYIANESFEVFVGPETWTESRRITFDATEQFEVNYFSDPPEIRFGDGVAGLIPEVGQEIQVNFVITKGLDGAIGSNQIESAQDQLVVQNNNIPLTIVSSTVASDGDDPEDLRSVKINAPEFFQSQNRAITKRDYDAIINTYPGVAKGDAQIIRDVDDDQTIMGYFDSLVDAVSGCSGTAQVDVANIVTNFKNYLDFQYSDTCRTNTVQVSILSKTGSNRYTSPSLLLMEDLRVHLEDINDIVHVVSVVDGSDRIVETDIEVEILVGFNFVVDDVIERARLALEKDDDQPYGLLILREYSDNLYLSDLYKAIRDNQETDGEIEYMNIRITDPTDKLDSDGNLILDSKRQEVIQPGTITITSIPRVVSL